MLGFSLSSLLRLSLSLFSCPREDTMVAGSCYAAWWVFLSQTVAVPWALGNDVLLGLPTCFSCFSWAVPAMHLCSTHSRCVCDVKWRGQHLSGTYPLSFTALPHLLWCFCSHSHLGPISQLLTPSSLPGKLLLGNPWLDLHSSAAPHPNPAACSLPGSHPPSQCDMFFQVYAAAQTKLVPVHPCQIRVTLWFAEG